MTISFYFNQNINFRICLKTLIYKIKKKKKKARDQI